MSEKTSEPILSDDFQAAQAALAVAIRDSDVATLETALKSRSYEIKTRAAEALGKVGGVQSVRRLRDMLAKPGVLTGGTETQMYQRQLDSAVIASLGQLTGADFGTVDPEADADVQRVVEQTGRWLERS